MRFIFALAFVATILVVVSSSAQQASVNSPEICDP
jgi:hypothetical protein